jgi:hypothetical protein
MYRSTKTHQGLINTKFRREVTTGERTKEALNLKRHGCYTFVCHTYAYYIPEVFQNKMI